MLQTLEATLDENGHIHFFEPVKISGLRRILVTLLDTPDKPVMTISAAQGMMPVRGAMKGMLQVWMNLLPTRRQKSRWKTSDECVSP
ncbi:MAG: hypothetical protein Q8O37_06000 [Sulfuricellaceae bacterium]|nr:hypothetical protein [Sulfuricellaceae bacterium]